MRCDKLRYFQRELEMAVHALRLIAGRPAEIRDSEILTARLELAHEALVEHVSTCLTCANERQNATLRSPDRKSS